MDFFTVSTLTGRLLFVLLVLAHRRRIVRQHHGPSDGDVGRPTGRGGVSDDTAPRGSTETVTALRRGVPRRELWASPRSSPRRRVPANPYVERVIGSIRRECLNHIIIFNAAHLRRVLTTYVAYYHRSRTHLGLDKDTPDHRPLSTTSTGRIVAIAEVGGLHHRYERLAA
jgi:hypothetical protein